MLQTVNLGVLDERILDGLNAFCNMARLSKIGTNISRHALEFLVFVLSERRDLPSVFPLGKDETIRQLKDLLSSKENDTDHPIDRDKVAFALDLLDEAGAGSLTVGRYGFSDEDWAFSLALRKKGLDVALKHVSRIKRKKPYATANHVDGECEIRGIATTIDRVAECEVVYEEYEEEVDEMVPTGKKVKVMKKRAITKCPGSDLTKRKEKNLRRVIP